MNFWDNHGTKILGSMTAVLGTLASLIATDSFDKLLTETSIGWLSIFVSLATAATGGATMARGFNNSGQVRIATAMEAAARATPPQGGFARPLMLALMLAVSVPAALILQGCQSLGIPVAKSFSERLAAGYASTTSVRTSATALLNGRVITSDDAINIQKQADVAREGLDVARTLPSMQAEDKLQATLLILQAAQSYLCGKNPNDPNCVR